MPAMGPMASVAQQNHHPQSPGRLALPLCRPGLRPSGRLPWRRRSGTTSSASGESVAWSPTHGTAHQGAGLLRCKVAMGPMQRRPATAPMVEGGGPRFCGNGGAWAWKSNRGGHDNGWLFLRGALIRNQGSAGAFLWRSLFSWAAAFSRVRPEWRSPVVASLPMCICVDCHWVDRCFTYHAVETRHGVKHPTPRPDFDPRQPRMNVDLRPQGSTSTTTVEGMLWPATVS